MNLIPLSGKYAVGQYSHAKVDDEDFAYLNQWRWKAKPNGAGTHVYAVRNETLEGKSVNVWMHREILCLSRYNPLLSDHIDFDTVNNTKANLRRVTASENVRHSRQIIISGVCLQCGADFHVFGKGIQKKRVYCSNSCATIRALERRNAHSAYQPRSSVYFKACLECLKPFVAKNESGIYCGAACRNRSLRRNTGDASGKAYVERNREAINLRAKAYYDGNKVAILARQRERRAI